MSTSIGYLVVYHDTSGEVDDINYRRTLSDATALQESLSLNLGKGDSVAILRIDAESQSVFEIDCVYDSIF